MVDTEPTEVMDAELILDSDQRIRSLNSAAESLFGSPVEDILGKPVSALGTAFPLPGRGPVLLGDLLSPRRADGGCLLLGRHHDGGIVPLRATSSAREGAIRVSFRLYPTRTAPEPGVAANDLETGNRRLAVFNGLLRLSSAGWSLPQQFEYFLDVALSLFGDAVDRRGAIFVVDERGELVLQAARNMPDAVQGQCQCLHSGACLCGHVGATGQSNALHAGCLPGTDSTPCIRDMDYFGVPVLYAGKLLGVLACIAPSGKMTSQADIGCLRIVADQLAALIERHRVESENRRLLEENRRLNRQLIRLLEDERRRLARDLHDDMGQSLTAIKTDAALIMHRCNTLSSPICRSARAIEETADHLYDVIQNLLRRLRPSALDDLGLVAALQAFIRTWREHRPGTACRFETEGDLDQLGEALNIAIYRIIQEALNNVIRHAAATRVNIVLRRGCAPDGKEELYLRVGDNGRGVELERVPAKQRYGLVGIRERVEALDGKLKLDSEPGRGFCLTAHLPVRDNPPADRQQSPN